METITLNKKKIKTLFNNFLIDYIILPFKEKYQIFIDNTKHTDTAYWFYEPPHNIVIGSEILKNIKKNFDKYDEYITAFIKHEVSHSLWTTQLEDCNELLELLNIPFHYLNLFEDARIEEIFRKNTKEFFNWNYYEELPLEKKNEKEILKSLTPLQIFFYFIYTENEKNIKFVDKNYLSAIKKHKFFTNIKKFYLRTIECENTIDIIPILKEFYKKYNNSKDNSKRKKYFISNDLNTKLSKGDKKKLVFVTDGSFDEKDRSFFDDKKIEDITLEDIKIIEDKLEIKHKPGTTKQPLFFDKKNKDIKFYNKVINTGENIISTTLKKIFKIKEYKQIKENVSKIIEPNRLVIDTEDIFIHKKKSDKGRRKKRKKLTLIVDTSGSMKVIYFEVITIIYIFNRLYQYKAIDLDIILSSGHSRKKPEYLKLDLPLRSEEILSIITYGAVEGLKHAFVKNKKIIQNSDIVFVLTDGMIVDEPINKKELNSQGIYTRAIYIKKNTKLKVDDNLYKYFDEVVVKDTIEKVFEEIILKLK